LRKVLKNSSRLIFALTLPTAFLFVFADAILGFGKEYVLAKDALLILTIGQAVCSIFGSAPVYLNMTGRQHIFQRIVLAVVLNLGLNRFLIPIYGMRSRNSLCY
jgi:O-antigen/teichoic acid export membrane protein